ncbi:eukaryotic mitochondrial regulator protein-domain-containing protein [Fomes fomentarius]|nr:eukaryotic mitochondrial regulator protein-domain-containing protein [Fomes fomentarius]
MLAHLAQASRRPVRSWITLASCRHYAAKSEGPEDPFDQGPTYAQWLRTEGLKYKEAHRPKNWLGGEVPFPLNPSFKPPTPISDRVRTSIWNDFMADPERSSARNLAERYGLSIARIDAILRLKGVEAQWRKQGKQLQTGFVEGMEVSLGIAERSNTSLSNRAATMSLGEDAVEADQLSEASKDVARVRYQRLFWEPVVEGKDPVTSDALARASVHGAESSKTREEALLKRLRHLKLETKPDVVLERLGRPTLRFVDVGVKFVDVKDRLKRVQAAKRRSLVKRRRRTVSPTLAESAQSAAGESSTATA